MTNTLSKDEILKKVSEVSFWGHSIKLPHGITTPGQVMDNLNTKQRLKLPDDLTGKKVLDIGTLDGFYSFECEKMGAEVLAIDNLERMQKPEEKKYISQGNRGFDVCKEILNSNVKFMNMDLYDISKEKIGTFDIVLFLGVLYHLKEPFLALEKIAEVTKDCLIIETAWMRSYTRGACLYFAESDSLNQDPTNWFMPNTECLMGMLRDTGFKDIEVLYKSPINIKSFLTSIFSFRFFDFGRIIVKAFK